ncbi:MULTISPECIES: hypothetical protein [Pontibacillus]|uniref:Uncharacterized protein n=1 Tax=Pontibacillus chungwhensis TaxID=265426 RepID=A0ABY8UT47_9BACI|nr:MULTISPECIES: hypothetical protein [Pontibacillus]MCD5323296.1 hypothetical protein [Pontibacillus sp. HN14]WIF96679.1 hypothetical protein QNI29_13065 [Pontibacillus chungwhensis]
MLNLVVVLCCLIPFIYKQVSWLTYRDKLLKNPRITSSVVLWLSFTVGLLLIGPEGFSSVPVIVAGLVLILTDYGSNYSWIGEGGRRIGRLSAVLIVSVFGDIQLNTIFFPSLHEGISLHYVTIPLTIIWFLFVMSMVHLASKFTFKGTRVLSIVLLVMLLLAVSMGHAYVVMFTGLLFLSIISTHYAYGDQSTSTVDITGFMIGVVTVFDASQTDGTFVLGGALIAITVVLSIVHGYRVGTARQKRAISSSLVTIVGLALVIASIQYVLLTFIGLGLLYLFFSHQAEPDHV